MVGDQCDHLIARALARKEGTMTHTPGPWQAKWDTVGLPGWSIAGADGTEIAGCTTGNPPFRTADECKADFHLIAAAPTLLEALDSTTSEFAYVLERGISNRLRCNEIITQARAAIAQAKGAA